MHRSGIQRLVFETKIPLRQRLLSQLSVVLFAACVLATAGCDEPAAEVPASAKGPAKKMYNPAEPPEKTDPKQNALDAIGRAYKSLRYPRETRQGLIDYALDLGISKEDIRSAAMTALGKRMVDNQTIAKDAHEAESKFRELLQEPVAPGGEAQRQDELRSLREFVDEMSRYLQKHYAVFEDDPLLTAEEIKVPGLDLEKLDLPPIPRPGKGSEKGS